jgi:hypothetical protein
MPRLLVFLTLVTPALGLGWGFDGHRKLASMMQDPLPANSCLRQWFASRQSYPLQDSACDPDRARYPGPSYDPDEATRHFLNIDWVNPPTDYPRDFAVAQAQLGVYATRNGTVPWRVDEQYRKLVSAFRSQVTTTILTEAFFFSHYVTDSFSVLHNTRNFDPNNGLHARWESEMLNSTANLVGIATLATSSYVGTPGRADPRHNIFDIVLVGNGLVGELIADDLAVDGGVQGLYFATRELTARRWGDALTVLSSLLWTAWAEAGSPELQGFTAGCSRAVPVGDIVLRGYPVPGGFLHPEWDGGVPGFDAGTIDAGTIDAGTVDAGTVDAGTADAGAVDAGTVDAGAIDADAGTVDAGTIDAGGGTGGGGGGGNSYFGGGTGFIGGGLGSGGGVRDNQPQGCSCGTVDAGLVLLGLLALVRRARR